MKKNNVKRLRRSYNLSQTEMAKELDIPQTRISEWELGKTQLSDEDAEMLAEYFEVTAAFVKGDTMNKQESYDDFLLISDRENDEYRAQNYQEIELLECYRYMESGGKNYLMQTVRMLKKYYGMK